jgi:thiol-disulfide isomerase/thioredoxin
LRLTRAPELSGVTAWINSPPLTLRALRGKVVVVHFWTHGCHNCVNNYPHYKSWQKRYEGEDVAFLGIHTPETPSERDIDRIRQQAEKNGLTFPIAVDNDGVNWRAWKNQYWPSVYVIDRRGRVRQGWEGELNYGGLKGEEILRRVIDALLREPKGR